MNCASHHSWKSHSLEMTHDNHLALFSPSRPTDRRGFRGGQGARAPLSEHTTITKFCGPRLSRLLLALIFHCLVTILCPPSNGITAHGGPEPSWSETSYLVYPILLFINTIFTFFYCRVSFCNITGCKKVNFLYTFGSSWWYWNKTFFAIKLTWPGIEPVFTLWEATMLYYYYYYYILIFYVLYIIIQ